MLFPTLSHDSEVLTCQFASSHPTRIALFTRSLRGNHALPETILASRWKHRERDVWQRRFWEHQIQDERDFDQPMDDVHDNPVRHGLVMASKDWVYSSFDRYGRDGYYLPDWGENGKIEFENGIGNE